MITVCLSHDIDRTQKTYQYFTKSLFSLLKFNFKGVKNQILSLKEKDPYWTFKDFIDIEEGFKVRSTVFFLNETIKLNIFNPLSYKLALGRYRIKDERIIDIIKWLDKNGWEIGVHGSYNSYKSKELLLKEKNALENIVKHPVIGIRQHYLNLNKNTWQYQKEVGFKYDSSWGSNYTVGFKDEKFVPFHPFNDHFTVIPLVIMDTCFMETKDRWKEFDRIIEICETKGAVLVINFHQHIFNKYDFPEFKEAYIELITKLKGKEAQFLTLTEMYKKIAANKLNFFIQFLTAVVSSGTILV
jgi:peptidoglycan/xylan/chitin deacetylase (PgdA/CDA1 family)